MAALGAWGATPSAASAPAAPRGTTRHAAASTPPGSAAAWRRTWPARAAVRRGVGCGQGRRTDAGGRCSPLPHLSHALPPTHTRMHTRPSSHPAVCAAGAYRSSGFNGPCVLCPPRSSKMHPGNDYSCSCDLPSEGWFTADTPPGCREWPPTHGGPRQEEEGHAEQVSPRAHPTQPQHAPTPLLPAPTPLQARAPSTAAAKAASWAAAATPGTISIPRLPSSPAWRAPRARASQSAARTTACARPARVSGCAVHS
jgi:hypothetical protein